MDEDEEVRAFVRGLDPDLELKYNKFYITLAKGSQSNTFVIFRAKKSSALAGSSAESVGGHRNKKRGFNIGKSVFGGSSRGSQSAVTVDTRARYVNVSLLDSVLADAVTEVDIESLKEFDGDSAETIVRTLLDQVVKVSTPIEADFAKTQDGQLTMRIGAVSQVLDKADADLLLKASQDGELNATSDQEVSNGQIKGKDAQTQSDKAKSEIEWTKKGEDWVPLSAKLRLVSSNNLRNLYSATWTEVIATDQTGLQARQLNHIKAIDSRYHAGFTDASKQSHARFAGPAKAPLLLPPGLRKHPVPPDPAKVHPSTQYGDPIYCDGLGDPYLHAMQLEFTPDAGSLSLSQFIERIGCRSGPECADEATECVAFSRWTNCYINEDWLAWYGPTIGALGLFGHHEDACFRGWRNAPIIGQDP